MSFDGQEESELDTIRRLLRPPPLGDLPNWGIPPEPDEPCGPPLEVSKRLVWMESQ
jgi:hypothetical protein